MPSCATLWKFSSAIALSRLLPALALASTASTFASGWDITKEELALLPPYCAHAQIISSNTQGSAKPEVKYWVGIMGYDFWGIHHYCYGQVKMLRAQRSGTSVQQRQFLLASARDEYDYVIKNSKSNFILLPEIYTRIGEVELRRSLPGEANKAFAKARALKPDYWPAYSRWADYLIAAGKAPEAKQLVKSGLEYSPNSRTLQEQYRLLGGKPSDIVPKNKEPLPEDKAVETIDPPSADGAPSETPVTSPAE